MIMLGILTTLLIILFVVFVIALCIGGLMILPIIDLAVFLFVMAVIIRIFRKQKEDGI